MTEPLAAGLPMPEAEQADLVEQARAVADDDVTEPDMSEMSWESEVADVVEQRLEVGYDDERDEPTGP